MIICRYEHLTDQSGTKTEDKENKSIEAKDHDQHRDLERNDKTRSNLTTDSLEYYDAVRLESQNVINGKMYYYVKWKGNYKNTW